MSNMIWCYMDIAHRFAKQSHAKRLQVGAVVVLENGVIVPGYNGTLPGACNECEEILPDGSLKTKPDVLHAEDNVFAKFASSTLSARGGVLFNTDAPCFECSKRIAAAKMSKVFYNRTYRDESGLKLLIIRGISVFRMTLEPKKKLEMLDLPGSEIRYTEISPGIWESV